MTIRRRDAASLTALGLLAACRSTEPLLYALLQAPGTPRRGGPRNVAVRAVSLARYLDRVQIVRSVDDYRLSADRRLLFGGACHYSGRDPQDNGA